MRHHMRAVILASGAMSEAMTFSTPLGFTLVDASPPARFRTLPAGDALINRAPAPHVKLTWWGRTMVRVDNVETLDAMAVAQGWTPSALRHGSWGERSFHRTELNGHELSFAQRLPSTATKRVFAQRKG